MSDKKIIELYPRYVTTELPHYEPTSVIEKLKGEKVDISIKDVYLESASFYHFAPNKIETKMSFVGVNE